MNCNFYAKKPNQKWVTDVTYILTNSKPQYLSIVRDLDNGKVIEYTLNEKNNVFLFHENIIKSWFSRFKNEVIYNISRSKWKPSDIKNIVDNDVEFYNFVRPIKKVNNLISNYFYFLMQLFLFVYY